MLLVTISRKFIPNFQFNFLKKLEGPLFNRSLLLSFKKTGKQELRFFGKSNSFFDKVSPSICNNSCLNLPNFFTVKLTSLKVYTKFKHLRWSFLRKQFMTFSC